jgi:uncharacterized membrane protein YdjX (TVP38/TMEM64 family)
MNSRPKPSSDQSAQAPSLLSLNGYLSKSGRKLLFLALGAVGCIALVHFTGLKQYLGNVHDLKDQLRALGVWGPVVFTTAVAVLVAVGVPRLLFCALGGLAFGFFYGLIWSQVGTLAGSYLTFVCARWGGKEWVSRKLAGFENSRLKNIVANPTVFSVFLARQIPVGGFFINLFLGVTSVGTGTFLVGSMLGFLPEAVIVTLIGSGLGKEATSRALLQVIVAIVCAAVVLGAAFLRKRSRLESSKLKVKG